MKHKFSDLYMVCETCNQRVENTDSDNECSDVNADLLRKKFKHWSTFATHGDIKMYIAVSHDDNSYCITVRDGYISTSSLLSTNVGERS